LREEYANPFQSPWAARIRSVPARRPNQPTLTDQFSQGAKYLVFTAKIDEFAGQKDGITLLGNPFFNLLSKRLSAGQLPLPGCTESGDSINGYGSQFQSSAASGRTPWFGR
jgi:hypothetical protein